MPRTEVVRQYAGQIALAAGAQRKQSTFEFTLGELWLAMRLRFAITQTVGASPVGGVAYEDPLLELIQNINLSVDRDDQLVNAPGKGMFYVGACKAGTQPQMDEASFAANTAAAYAMTCDIPIFFADRKMVRPEDTALATDRYTRMDLNILTGNGADALSTAHSSGGGITLSVLTCDVEIEKVDGPIHPNARPNLVTKYMLEDQPQDSSAGTQLKLERNPQKAIKRLYAFVSNLGVTGRPWSGNGNNATLNTIKVPSNLKDHDNARLAAQVRGETKDHFGLETAVAGLHAFDFAKDGSNYSALATGDKSKLNVEWAEVASGAPSGTRRVAVISESVHQLK